MLCSPEGSRSGKGNFFIELWLSSNQRATRMNNKVI